MNHQETKFIIASKIKIFALNIIEFSISHLPGLKSKKKNLQAQDISNCTLILINGSLNAPMSKYRYM